MFTACTPVVWLLCRSQGTNGRLQGSLDPASMRGDYSVPGAGLVESDAHLDPMQQFDKWCTPQHHTEVPLLKEMGVVWASPVLM